MKYAKIIPILTVAAVFAAVAIIMSSVMSDHGERMETVGSGADAVPDTESDATPETVPSDGVTTEAGTSDRAGAYVTAAESSDVTTVPETEPAPVQTIPVGIYKKDGKTCRLLTEYKSVWPASDEDKLWKLDTWTYKDRENLICDIDYFAVFTSDEEKIDFSYWDKTWVDRWESCGLDDTYKIGFELEIVKKSGEPSERITVLSPSDTFKAEKYFELYLYDCVAHAHDSWYSHITEKTNYDDTKNVMIKITLRDGCYDVESILLTAFVYSGADEFDADGFYIGANKYTITVSRE